MTQVTVLNTNFFNTKKSSESNTQTRDLGVDTSANYDFNKDLNGDLSEVISRDDIISPALTIDPFITPIATSSNRRLSKIKRRRDSEKNDNLMFKSEISVEGFPDGGKEAYLTLLGSFMGLIIDFGIANSLGAIESYVSAHQLANVEDSLVSWVFTLHLGVMYFGGVIFGELFDRYGAKKLLIGSTILMTGGLIATAESTKLYQFILSFGILTAIGTSMGMAPLIGSLSHWFLKKRAMASSLATIGGLVGSSVFAIMLQKLYGKVGFKWAIRILAFICIFCMSFAILLIKPNPKLVKQDELEDAIELDTIVEESNIKSNKFNSNSNSIKKLTTVIKEMFDFNIMKDKRFIFLSISVFLSEIISLSSLTYLTSYGLDHGVSETNAYLLITLVNVSGIPSRLLSGIIADKYGRFNVMIFMSILTTIVIFALWLPSKGNVGLLFTFSIFFGMATSATISLIPACTSQICSVDKFGKVYGTLYFILAFLTILGMYISSVVLSNRTNTNYRNFIIFEGVLSFVSVISWFIGRFSCVGVKWCKF